MESLRTFSNLVGPWTWEISFLAFAVTGFFLVLTIKRLKSLDAAIVLAYLSILLAVGNSGIWINPIALMVVHLLLYTSLVGFHTLFGALQTRYGDIIMHSAGFMGFTDAIFFSFNIPLPYLAWVLFLIFLSICGFTIYAVINAHDNRGKLGKYLDVANGHYKESTQAVQN